MSRACNLRGLLKELEVCLPRGIQFCTSVGLRHYFGSASYYDDLWHVRQICPQNHPRPIPTNWLPRESCSHAHQWTDSLRPIRWNALGIGGMRSVASWDDTQVVVPQCAYPYSQVTGHLRARIEPVH